MKTVKVFGLACKRCEATEAMVGEAAARLGIPVEVDQVTDPKSITMAGVMPTPGLSVDGKLVHADGRPAKGRKTGRMADSLTFRSFCAPRRG